MYRTRCTELGVQNLPSVYSNTSVTTEDVSLLMYEYCRAVKSQKHAVQCLLQCQGQNHSFQGHLFRLVRHRNCPADRDLSRINNAEVIIAQVRVFCGAWLRWFVI